MATQDETTIRAVIDARAEALRTRDPEALFTHLAEDEVSYTLAAPLRNDGVDHAGLTAWLNSWTKLDYEVTRVGIKVSGDLAIAYSIDRMNGTKDTGDGGGDLWFRVTLVFERRAGQWKIIHEHQSVPFSMEFSEDGVVRALVDLEP